MKEDENPYMAILHLIAKPVSLNDLIDQELKKNKSLSGIAESTHTGNKAKDFSLHKVNAPTSWLKSKLKGKVNEIPGILNIYPFKNKKKFQIRSPLRPKKLKTKLRNKRKDQAIDRNIHENDETNQKYIPLLRNLGMLFDTLIKSNTSDTTEIAERIQSHKSFTNDRRRMVCTCGLASHFEEEPLSKETTTVTSQAIATTIKKITKTTAKTAPNTSMGDFGIIRQNKNISLLPSRDTSSGWRDNNGHSKRSRSTFHRSTARNIPRNNGNSKCNTRVRENESYTKSHEENSNCITRNYASGHELRRRNGNDARNTGNNRTETDEKFEKDENTNELFTADKYKKYDKHEIRGNETESSNSISEHDRGLRGFHSKIFISNNTESLQSEKSYEKSKYHVTHNHTSYKRVPNGNGTATTDVEEAYTEHETVISIKDLSNLTLALQSAPQGKLPVVTIFDGYSVARDINGQNRLLEQSIHIHS
ncbi:uncharacterized protein LOC131841723 [Achroia grisella]|uniref:uncharacterized protein LOC131841723 n=1 Tax=Achroia grisella TaxID=688607 RepID=UPI0027D2A8D0|nr:uncharacterized protein LOC131841723 [Achroia grisella]